MKQKQTKKKGKKHAKKGEKRMFKFVKILARHSRKINVQNDGNFQG